MNTIRFNYIVRWTEQAEKKLKAQVEYIFSQSLSRRVADNFYKGIKTEVGRLSILAGVYRLKTKKELSVKKRFKVKFLIDGDFVYIVDFISSRQLKG